MYEKIVLITRKTRLEGLIERFNTKAQAQFYIEHSGGDFGMYQQEHDTYYAAVAELQRSLQGLLKLQRIEREFLPNFIFSESDLVVTIGIDGLVVNTAKYLTGQPLVAVNPDPAHIDGILLPFAVPQAAAAVRRTLQSTAVITPITMAEASLNDGQQLLAFNDLFVGRQDHVSARYRIEVGDGRSEHHSSSGIIISTGAGATVSKTSAAGIVCGSITPEAPLRLESAMPEGGVIFSDGVIADYLAFNAGTIATIGLARQKTHLVTS
ncbi:MAG: hypothetical protein P8183_21120 [Anaerolineae bacterium]